MFCVSNVFFFVCEIHQNVTDLLHAGLKYFILIGRRIIFKMLFYNNC